MNLHRDAIRNSFKGELLEQELLSRHTSLQVGGPADLFAIPRDRVDLLQLLNVIEERQIPWFVIGGGYNLLVRDNGFRGIVISLKMLNNMETIGSDTIHVEAGVRNIDLSRLAEAHGLTGMEFLVGIPGTLGGAVKMNAGAHGGEIFDHISSLDILVDGDIRPYTKDSLQYGYRSLQLDPEKIIIAATFQLAAGTRDKISSAMDACLQRRQETQKVKFPNAGSFFKNPAGQAAWRLIEAAGLRGMTVGTAQVSEVHCNFLVNKGNATAADFIRLAAIVKEQVFNTSGVRLEEEVQIMGEG